MTRSWKDAFKAFLEPSVLVMFFLGFASGLPLLLVFGTLSFWLREAGIERATIGFLSWIGLAWAFKFVWAPLIDKIPVPLLSSVLGQRRAWILAAQLLIILGIFLIALNDPAFGLTGTVVGAVLLAYASATQDIAIDAYRIEIAEDDLQGVLTSSYQAGYRIAMLVAGGGALGIVAWLDADPKAYDYSAWFWSYVSMACIMGIGVITAFLIREPERPGDPSPRHHSPFDHLRILAVWAAATGVFVLVNFGGGALISLAGFNVTDPLGKLGITAVIFALGACFAAICGYGLVRFGAAPRQAVYHMYVSPFREFIIRHGVTAVAILALISLYRIADIVMGVMASVFYVDIGFTKGEVAAISKTFGVGVTIFGAFVGGLLVMRMGIFTTLLWGAVLAAATNVLFAVIALTGPDTMLLTGVIVADNMAGGIAGSAFIAYLSSLVNRSYTATQYALFSSVMLLLPKTLAGYSGVMVDVLGWPNFFVGTALLGLPVVALIIYLRSGATSPTD